MGAPRITASNNPPPRAVLWDLDGTLADSSEFHWQSWGAALAAEGVHITKADFLASFGQRNSEILARWLGPHADAERIQNVGDAKEISYRAIVEASGLAPLPGAGEWVRRLHAAGWRQAIASSAPRLNVAVMRRVLGFDALIEEYVGAEDVTAGKPDPEVFLTAAARLGVPPERCVVVEDAAAGIEAARRAHMRRIYVGAGSHQHADIAVGSLTELSADAFDQLLNSAR
jgi:HAD superfamily hydrolase (TIGR01509 family)